MKTNANKQIWVLGICAAAMCLIPPAWAGGGADGGGKGGGEHRAHREQRLQERAQHIAERLQRLQQAIAAHPNAPADVKAAAEKLLADLKDAAGDVDKIKAALEAHDKAALEGMKGELKKDHATIKADREALHAAIKAATKDIHGMLPGGQGGHHGQRGAQTTGA